LEIASAFARQANAKNLDPLLRQQVIGQMAACKTRNTRNQCAQGAFSSLR
jgi:predicted metal-dependent hydrolase